MTTADAIKTVQSLIAEGKLTAEPYLTLRHEVEVSLFGETYENREAIKAAGFKWNGVSRRWQYTAKASRDDAMLMAFARDFTERKVEDIEEAERRAALTDEEREAEDRKGSEELDAHLKQIRASKPSRKARARRLA